MEVPQLDPLPEDDIVDFEEFESYAPILGAASVVAVAGVLIATAVLHRLGAPGWTVTGLQVLCVTLPCAAFARWVWHKPAIRMPTGYVLQQHVARALAVYGWGASVMGILIALWLA